MNNRHVFSVNDIAAAQSAVQAARAAGLPDDQLSLVARADIELEDMPDKRKDAGTDFKPAAMRGAAAGGATGLLVGLAAAAFPPLGVTLAGAALMTAGGAAIGTWAAALVGSTVEDPVRRKFEQEIEEGRVLLVIDADEELLPAVEAALTSRGARHMPYETPSAMT